MQLRTRALQHLRQRTQESPAKTDPRSQFTLHLPFLKDGQNNGNIL